MSSLYLSSTEKDDVQIFVENLQADSRTLDGFSTTFMHGNEAAWYRFIKGTYNHPLTWWIGIFQLLIQMGVWGHRHQAAASMRANHLWQISEPLRQEVENGLKGQDVPLLSAIVRYNLKHRKSDIAGRLLGGAFTNYATTGGRLGNKALANAGKAARRTIKVTAAFTNFGIASYGAAIKALAQGHKSLEAIIQSVLTGRPEHLPAGYRSDNGAAHTTDEQKLLENLEAALSEVMSLTQATSGPVPIKEFCSRPENIDLKGVCR